VQVRTLLMLEKRYVTVVIKEYCIFEPSSLKNIELQVKELYANIN